MWTYIYSNELAHHGVKGMKWGVRRSQESLDRLAGRVKKEEENRASIKKEKGVLSKQYRNASKKLYVTKAKQTLEKAKLDGDKAGILLAKEHMRFAKSIKKYGSGGHVNAIQREIYGNLHTKELGAIELKEIKHTQNTQRGKAVARTTLAVLGSVAVTVLAEKRPNR